MADRHSATVVLMLLGLVSQPVPLSLHFLERSTGQTSVPTPPAGNGTIAGVVVNERHEPVARVVVQAFPASATAPQAAPRRTAPPQRRASGSAYTDNDGRFRISALAAGEYVVAAEPVSMLPSEASPKAEIYATTFYPSTIREQEAARVSASAGGDIPIQIELVRVGGARVSGSVVSASGRPTAGMSLRLFRRFGDFASESPVGAVSATGTFEIPRVAPGWYRLSIGSPESRDGRAERADTLIEVDDRDLDDLALVLRPGASISGRVVVEAGSSVPSAVGLRVSASVGPEEFSASRSISAPVADDWSFRITGLSAVHRFTISGGRPPFVAATRIMVNGKESPASAAVELADGNEVVVFVKPRELPQPAVDKTLSAEALVEQFKSERVFWRQFPIAELIVERHDAAVLPALAVLLTHEDRHVRGNAAFIFAGLGDPRGFQVITDILTDRSDRPEGQGIAIPSGDGRYRVARQIATDRYYAAHLLGDLRDPRAIPILVPLLQDTEVSSIVPWALGQIGDQRAVGPLLDALDDPSPSIRVLAIYALETLHAREALPRLTSLLDDHRTSSVGAQVTVAAAAKAAIAKLQ